MNRRDFITLLGGAALAWPRAAAKAQQPARMRCPGILTGLAADDVQQHADVAALTPSSSSFL